MDLARHLEIGAAALARGLVEARRLADAVAELAVGTHGVEFWLGFLSAGDLEEILGEVEDAHRIADGSAATLPHRSRRSHRSLAPTALLHRDTDPNPDASTLDIDFDPAPPVTPRGTDRYTEVAVRGEGGMGAVIECQDTHLGRRVALKHLRPEFVGDKGASEMLAREAQVTGSLEHPNIVPVYDIGETPKGGPYYVMRLVAQPTLGEVLLKLGTGDADATATYTPGRLLRHFIQICETVDYAHSRGVVHCDLKPANVLLGDFGEVLVLDWGLAYRISEGTAYRGGTPGYMAPEQLHRKSQIDARTDVYALGVILYEMLAQGSFAESSLTTILPRPSNGRPPARDTTRRPSLRAPQKKIAAELDDICARALAEEPADRFASARELAAAVAVFLEGTKERERRQQKADESCAEGDRLAESFLEFLESRPERAAEVTAIRAALAPWEPAPKKRDLWDAEDRLAVTDALEVRTFQAAAAAYEQALEEAPGHAGARRGLARIYLAQLEDAGRRQDDLDRIYFEELVKQYDDGTLLGATRAEGTLRLTALPDGRVSVVMLEEKDRRLVAGREQLVGPTPLTARLPPGRYAGTFADIAGRTARFPLDVPAGKSVELAIDLQAAGGPAPGEVLVPGGPALLGVDDGALRSVDVAAFYMARFPVTFAEFLAFLDDLRGHDRDAAARWMPRTSDGMAYWKWSGTAYVPGRAATFSDDEDHLMRLPVFGVDAHGAEAYAAWLSQKTGRAYRLPTENEWEKAARGVDGRRYPWGDRFDASFCKMRLSRPGLARPEPSGAFEIDESPYGVRDVAGGIADWVVPSGGPAVVVHDDLAARQMQTRGGSWSDLAVDCAVHVKRPYLAVERSSRVGFRLARSA